MEPYSTKNKYHAVYYSGFMSVINSFDTLDEALAWLNGCVEGPYSNSDIAIVEVVATYTVTSSGKIEVL